MKKQATIGLMVILAMLSLLSINACSTYQPYAYHEERDIMPGPGLFSGEDGEFTLFRLPDKKAVSEPGAAATETEIVERSTAGGPESGR